MPQSRNLASVPHLRGRISRAIRNQSDAVQIDPNLADALLQVYEQAQSIARADSDRTHESLHRAVARVKAADG